MYICIVFGDKNVYKKEFVQVDLYMVPVLFRSVCVTIINLNYCSKRESKPGKTNNVSQGKNESATHTATDSCRTTGCRSNSGKNVYQCSLSCSVVTKQSGDLPLIDVH